MKYEFDPRLDDDVDSSELLAQAERVSITYGDAECSFAASAASGGSASPLL